MAEGDTLPNALIGAVVTVLTAGFLPFSPLLGGAVAGYLEGGDRAAGTRVGLYAGLVALIPALVFGTLIAGVFGAMFIGVNPWGTVAGSLGLVALFFGLVFGLIYFVGFSAVGGYLGNYLRNDTDLDL
ncbi:MAG: DUF5518 domain-containing protein [Haloarculaceae archaeon]